ncbi:MAG: hypothetical protein K6G89_04770 [Clostridia bacterium]|nr:hypothetical protein [Clostridia bacterium]
MTGNILLQKIALLAGEAAEATPDPTVVAANRPPITVFIIIGSAVALIVAIILAVRSSNKKYGKDW